MPMHACIGQHTHTHNKLGLNCNISLLISTAVKSRTSNCDRLERFDNAQGISTHHDVVGTHAYMSIPLWTDKCLEQWISTLHREIWTPIHWFLIIGLLHLVEPVMSWMGVHPTQDLRCSTVYNNPSVKVQCMTWQMYEATRRVFVDKIRIKCRQFLANVNSRSRSLYVVVRPSVVCRLSVTFVRPTQATEIFGNVSTLFGTLAICWHPGKILRRSSQGNPSVGGVKHKRGGRI